MWASIVTSGGALPKCYAVAYLIVAAIDCFTLLLWGSPFDSGSNMCVLALQVIRLVIACLLCVGIYQRNIWKCKIFCVIESVLLSFQFIILVTVWDKLGEQIYTIIILVLRCVGIKIIRAFVTVQQCGLGIFV